MSFMIPDDWDLLFLFMEGAPVLGVQAHREDTAPGPAQGQTRGGVWNMLEDATGVGSCTGPTAGGRRPGGVEKCPACNGEGFETIRGPWAEITRKCRKCGGTGERERRDPVRITEEQTNACTCPLAMGVIGAEYNVFVYPQDDCPIHGERRE